MKKLLHANSLEIFDVLTFFGLRETDRITNFSLLVNESIAYTYSYYSADEESQPTCCVIPFNREVWTVILELLGVDGGNVTELCFSISANKLAEITIKKEISVESIKRQPLTLFEILEKNNHDKD